VTVLARRDPLAESLSVVSSGSNPIDFEQLVLKDDVLNGVKSDDLAAKYLRQFSNGSDFINGDTRWCLWLKDAPAGDISNSPVLSERVARLEVLRRESDRSATQQLSRTPTLFGEDRQPNEEFLAFPQTFTDGRKFMTVGYMSPSVIIGMKIYWTVDPDGLQFAVASSSMMLAWQRTVGGRLKSDPSFSNTLVWNTFPFPTIDHDQRRQMIEGGEAVLAARAKQPGRTLAEMYEPTAMAADLIEAHDQLDAVVDSAFGFDCPPTIVDRQKRLFDLYTEMTTSGQLALPSARAKRPRRR